MKGGGKLIFDDVMLYVYRGEWDTEEQLQLGSVGRRTVSSYSLSYTHTH